MAKTILPSLREKKRYLAFELISKAEFTFSKVKKAILDSSQLYLGQLGMAKAGIIVLGDNYKDNKGLIKVNTKYVNELKASLALVKDIDKKQVIFKSIGVSGMLNKASKKLEGN